MRRNERSPVWTSALLIALVWSTTADVTAGTWSYQCVDCPPSCDAPPRSITVASDGTVRILMSNSLWVRNGTDWEAEALPMSSGVAVGCELDASGTLHAVVDTDERFWLNGIGYLRRDSDTWLYEVVHDTTTCSGYTVGWGADIAVEDDGTSHLLYPDTCGLGLHHAYQDGSGWTSETILDTDAIPQIAAVVTETGLVRVAYYDKSHEEVRFAWETAPGTWSTETIVSAASDVDIALDAAGTPHVACIGSGNLIHAWRTAGSWQTEIVGPGESGSAVAVDSGGNIHVAWVAPGTTAIRHAVFDGTNWTVETAFSESSGSVYLSAPSMTADGNGAVHMAFSDTAGEAFHLTNETGDWIVTYLCTRYRPGAGPDLERTPAGALMVVSSDLGIHVVRLAEQDACGAWQAGTLDPGGPVVGFASLAVDDAGRPNVGLRISLSGHQEIRYGVRDGGSWTWETAASSSEVNQDPLLLLDPDGHPHLIWNEGAGSSTPSALRHGWHDGSSWNVETIDDNGSHLSAVMDSAGTIHLAYRHEYELRHAVLVSGGTWSVETVGGGTVDTCIGTNASIALDGSGNPAIAYFDCNLPWTPKPILLARWNGSDWETEEAVEDAGAWVALSLAFDASDDPFIAWANRLSSKTGGAWQTGTFWDDDVGPSDLLFETADTPSISFATLGKKLWIARPSSISANDVNGDGSVDADDMEALVAHIFGVPAPNPDLSHDCIVDARDTAVLIRILTP